LNIGGEIRFGVKTFPAIEEFVADIALLIGGFGPDFNPRH